MVQADLVKNVHQGFQERGAPWTGDALAWSSEVSSSLLKSDRPELVGRGLALTSPYDF